MDLSALLAALRRLARTDPDPRARHRADALVSVAATLAVSDGTVDHARVVLGGVANTPLRVPEAERALVGSGATDEAFARAADIAVRGAEPLEHNGYKIPLARSLVQRALTACLDAPSPER